MVATRTLFLAALGVVVSFVVSGRDAFAAGRQRALSEVIHVHPGATCVDADTLTEDVAAWLGTETADADVWVRVHGSPDDARTVSFEMGRGDHVVARRRFSPGPERCDHLQAALGLAIALALRASLLDEMLGPREEAAPQGSVQTEGSWAVAGGPVAALGVLPGPALGGALRVERAFPPNFALRLGVMGFAAWDRTFATVAGSFDAETFALRLDACVRVDLAETVAGRVCAGVVGGELLAQGRDFASSRSASSEWLAVANGVEVDVALAGRWALAAEGTLLMPLGSTQVGVLSARGDVVEARDLSSVGVTMMLGPAYRF